MPVRKYGDIEEAAVNMKDVTGVTKKVPIGKGEGWTTNTLRVFKVAPGGHTPRHSHDWEHVNYVMAGKGRLTINDETFILEKNDFALVPPGATHQYENPFEADFEFICIVPAKGDY